jgi:predicted transcriptional regulator
LKGPATPDVIQPPWTPRKFGFIDTKHPTPYTGGMNLSVDLSPDLHAKLARLAAQEGRDTEALAREAIERLVDYSEWFLREVDIGLSAADRGEFVEHEDVRKLLDSRYPG